MSILGNDLLLAGTDEGYNLTRSLRFRSSASAYLNRTFSSGDQVLWTWSAWVKRGTLGTYQILFGRQVDGNTIGTIGFDSDKLAVNNKVGGSTGGAATTNAVFRDPSAWYHIVVAYNGNGSAATDKFKVYVNSVLQTFSSTENYSTGNGYINSSVSHAVGRRENLNDSYFDGYMTEINFIGGQALTPSSFGETDTITGVWKPKRYAGTYGTNGFYLPFTDNSALTTSSNVGLGKDFSGNGNYWTTNNISITAGVTYDSMTDVPTLTSATAANFAVLNPLKSYYAPTNGNLTMSTGANSTGIDVASISLGTGVKYYFEATATGTNQQIGIFSSNHSLTPTGSKRYWYLESGGLYNDGTLLQSVATFTSGDTIAVAWDGTAQTVTFYKNNTQQGTAISVDTSYSYFFGVGAYNGGWNVNFGQRPFTYTPPTGYVALNTFNLPTSTIVKGNTVMDATLYTGNGLTQTITNSAGFKPDLVWGKSRSNVVSHCLIDSVRGASKALFSNLTNAEDNSPAYYVTGFNSNGFDLGLGIGLNNVGYTYTAWQWQAGQGTTSTNTSGTITSTVSVNASAGFSVVTYTGTGANATVGHGLGVAPSLIIVKNRDYSPSSWITYHQSLSNTQAVYLNTTDSVQTSSLFWNSTSPTSSVFSLASYVPTNGGGNKIVAYCWTPIAGYSAFGSYTGNGSNDGVFVYTGFKPRWVMLKIISGSGGGWIMYDTARKTYNVNDTWLYANDASAENVTPTYDLLDIVSNGFKLRSANYLNVSGDTLIYAAFAEVPFKHSLAR